MCYDLQIANYWDSLQTEPYESCAWCDGFIPLHLATYTELNAAKVFCCTVCSDEWLNENEWEYEEVN